LYRRFRSRQHCKSGEKFLARFACNGLLFDDTFDVTRYSFRLASLLVATASGRGFPCCSLISYRITSKELSKSIPHLDKRYSMTSDTNIFYNAYDVNFRVAQKILCSFHISKCVKRKFEETLQVVLISRHIGPSKTFVIIGGRCEEATPARFEREYAAFILGSHRRAESHFEESARHFLRKGLTDVLKDLRLAIEEAGERA
ncbi:hypothetical protein COOONC_23806, partial [Cooperia oncophora]